MLPNFFVIGAAKSGTSALHSYLSLHPQIHMSVTKETHYFADPAGWFPFGRISDRVEYEAEFETDLLARGESSPSYSLWPLQGGVPERIRASVPEAKFIYLVRDPIDRMRALYLQRAAWQEDLGSLEEALGDIRDPCNEYTIGSLYMQQVRRYLDIFCATRILILDQACLRTDRRGTLQAVFAFLGVQPFWSDAFLGDANVTSDKRIYPAAYRRIARSDTARSLLDLLPASVRSGPVSTIKRSVSKPLPDTKLSAELSAECMNLFAPDVAELREFSGFDFADWSV